MNAYQELKELLETKQLGVFRLIDTFYDTIEDKCKIMSRNDIIQKLKATVDEVSNLADSIDAANADPSVPGDESFNILGESVRIVSSLIREKGFHEALFAIEDLIEVTTRGGKQYVNQLINTLETLSDITAELDTESYL
ncbi:MAG: hypothetical protein WC783_04465 [Candidatus Paceibacterota bacterium]|jgi:hypothetical protein